MSDNNQKGYLESAMDKTKEIAHDVKETVTEKYDKLVGNRNEDKAAREIKKTVDSCASKVGNARDDAADKMREAARTIEGH